MYIFFLLISPLHPQEAILRNEVVTREREVISLFFYPEGKREGKNLDDP